jgi:hypothetical protein
MLLRLRLLLQVVVVWEAAAGGNQGCRPLCVLRHGEGEARRHRPLLLALHPRKGAQEAGSGSVGGVASRRACGSAACWPARRCGRRLAEQVRHHRMHQLLHAGSGGGCAACRCPLPRPATRCGPWGAGGR